MMPAEQPAVRIWDRVPQARPIYADLKVWRSVNRRSRARAAAFEFVRTDGPAPWGRSQHVDRFGGIGTMV